MTTPTKTTRTLTDGGNDNDNDNNNKNTTNNDDMIDALANAICHLLHDSLVDDDLNIVPFASTTASGSVHTALSPTITDSHELLSEAQDLFTQELRPTSDVDVARTIAMTRAIEAFLKVAREAGTASSAGADEGEVAGRKGWYLPALLLASHLDVPLGGYHQRTISNLIGRRLFSLGDNVPRNNNNSDIGAASPQEVALKRVSKLYF
jgi:hypothetical protein